VSRADGWLRGDFHFHTNYSDDALEQGGDWVGAALRISEYYENPVFLESFPQYENNHLDFINISDHRTTEGCSDPEFASDSLVLICGEEFGSTGHANTINVSETISSDPVDGRTANEQIQWAIDRTVEIGGIFSANHPAGDDDMWFWDVTGYEGAEVFNQWWTLNAPPTPESVLDEHVANYGVENRFIRRALREQGRGLGGQYLAFYEAHLVAGIPLAAMGGGDRHMLIMPAHPTTYVQVDERSPDGVVDAIRNRRTFVSRSPVAPQVLISAEANGETYSLGDVVPAGSSVTLRAHVGRGSGGMLRIIAGPIIRDITREELLERYPLGDVIVDVPITSDDFTYETRWNPDGEAWVYAMVLENTDASNLPNDVQQDLTMLRNAMEWYGMRYGQLARAVLPLIDVMDLLWPTTCDPSDWDVNRTVCVDVDEEFMGTVHFSEAVDRVLNLYRENDELTDYAMGAITSPITVEN
jgi:hypothetical protein